MYFVMNMLPRKVKATRAKKARVSVVEPTTAVDNAPSTPVDASVNLSPTSDESSEEEVTGLVERLNLTGAASNPDGAAGGDGGTVVDRAGVLKTQGNNHFKAGACHRALLCYSEAIEVLEGAGHDAALATLLCNRSIAHLKSDRPAAALVDAERARTLGGAKAHFRLAEALAYLGFSEEALAAYGAALSNAPEADKPALRGKIEELQRGRVEVRATPEDFAGKLIRAVAGTTLLLAPGRYTGPFEIGVNVRIVGGGGQGDVVLDCTEGGDPTLQVCSAGRVVLQSLDVRRGAGSDSALKSQALVVLNGEVCLPNCFDWMMV